MGITLDELRIFTVAARLGSLGQTARTLALSQPSASERLARLERKLGTRLLTRTPRGVTLTPGGTRLLPYALRCIELADAMMRAAGTDTGTNTLTLAVHSMFSPLICQAVRQLNQYRLQIITKDAHSDQIIQMLTDQQADVGIVTGLPHPPSVTLQHLVTTPAIAVAAPTHPLAARRQITVADLAAYAVAVNASGPSASRFFDLLAHAQLPHRSLRIAATAEIAAHLARHEEHVAVLFHISVADELASGNLTQLPVTDLPLWTLDLYLAYRIADKDRPEITALRRLSHR
jgi:DNA-binding transcriptional LysR family regulator